jgi:excinuclease ABC subunit A
MKFKKIIPNPKLSIKAGGFCSWEYKSSWILQLEIIGEKFGFKLTDAVTISGGSDGNDFEWWQKKNSH